MLYDRMLGLIRLARAFDADYSKDPDPKHWKTINGSHVHLDKNGNYDGGAGGKFNGRHHYGVYWREKSALMDRFANALRTGVSRGKQEEAKKMNTPKKETNVSSAFEAHLPKQMETVRKEMEKSYQEDVKNYDKDLKEAKTDAEKIKAAKLKSKYFDRLEKIKFMKYKPQDVNIADLAKEKGQSYPPKLVGDKWDTVKKNFFDIGSRTDKQIEPLRKLPYKMSENEIIYRTSWTTYHREGEGDQLPLALSYMMNKAGYDVRWHADPDGNYISTPATGKAASRWTYQTLFTQPGFKCFKTPKGSNSAKNLIDELSKNGKDGEGYFLMTGNTGMVVKKDGDKFEYLNQKTTIPGWQTLGSNAKEATDNLKKITRTYSGSYYDSFLVSTDELKNSPMMLRVAQVINNEHNFRPAPSFSRRNDEDEELKGTYAGNRYYGYYLNEIKREVNRKNKYE